MAHEPAPVLAAAAASPGPNGNPTPVATTAEAGSHASGAPAAFARFERVTLEDLSVPGIGWMEAVLLRRAPLVAHDGSETPRRLVLFHGLGDAPVSWLRVLQPRFPRHEILLPALPGVGRGPLPPGRDHLTHQETVDWTASLLHRIAETGNLVPERPRQVLDDDDDLADPQDAAAIVPQYGRLDLVGHSLGGWLLARALLDMPEVLPALTTPPTLINNAGTWYDGVERERDLLTPKRLEDLDETLSLIYAEDPGLPIEALDAMLQTMRSPAYQGLLWSTETHEFLDAQRLSQLPAHTHLIWGMQDQLVPPQALAALQAHIPSVAFHPIEECGHAPHMEAPEALGSILASYLD